MKPSKKKIESTTALIDEYLDLFEKFKEACKIKESLEREIIIIINRMTIPQRKKAANILLKKSFKNMKK